MIDYSWYLLCANIEGVCLTALGGQSTNTQAYHKMYSQMSWTEKLLSKKEAPAPKLAPN